MKAVYAYVKRSKFDDVSMALHQIPDVSGITVSGTRGWGRGGEAGEEEKQYEGHLEENVKIEIVCRDELVGSVVATIRKHGHTGIRGDGLVYVFAIDDAIRIGADLDDLDEADG